MSDPKTPTTPNGEKKYLFDNPRNVKLVVRGLLVSCAIMGLQ